MKSKLLLSSLLTMSTLGVAEGQFGAACYSKYSGAIGTSSGMYSQNAAKNKALADGNFSHSDYPICRVVQTYCVGSYYDYSENSIVWAEGYTLNQVKEIAESNCYAVSTKCKFSGATCGKVSR